MCNTVPDESHLRGVAEIFDTVLMARKGFCMPDFRFGLAHNGACLAQVAALDLNPGRKV